MVFVVHKNHGMDYFLVLLIILFLILFIKTKQNYDFRESKGTIHRHLINFYVILCFKISLMFLKIKYGWPLNSAELGVLAPCSRKFVYNRSFWLYSWPFLSAGFSSTDSTSRGSKTVFSIRGWEMQLGLWLGKQKFCFLSVVRWIHGCETVFKGTLTVLTHVVQMSTIFFFLTGKNFNVLDYTSIFQHLNSWGKSFISFVLKDMQKAI